MQKSVLMTPQTQFWLIWSVNCGLLMENPHKTCGSEKCASSCSSKCLYSCWSFADLVTRHIRRCGFVLMHPIISSAGAANHRQTDPDGEADREGPLRRGVDGPLEGRTGRRQGLLHHRRGQLVQRDRDLPDRPDATREHPGYGKPIWICQWPMPIS